MKHVLIIFLFISTLFSQSLKEIDSHRILLPNGWSVTPIGKSLPLGDLPLNVAVSPSQKYLAVANNGQSVQTIQLIDANAKKILDSTVIAKAWVGLTFSGDEKNLYASGGNDNWILRYKIINNKLSLQDTFILGKPWPEKISPSGIAVNDNNHTLYVVTKENNSLYTINIESKSVTGIFPLNAEGYTCLLSPDKRNLYVSCWGSGVVKVFSTEKQIFTDSISVGSNPNDICIAKSGKFLFVANANDNTVSVVDLQQKKVIEVLNAALYANAPSGSTTNSVALNEENNILYVANADNNCLAAFDVHNPGLSKSKGYIPTGWYPTCVRVVGKTIFVANGKGFSSQANPYGPNPSKKTQKVAYQHGDSTKQIKVQYIGGLFKGTLSIIPVPDEKQLSIFSEAVYRNTPYHKEQETIAKGEEGNPIPRKVGDASPIKHVFYIIKENRTYDQVLGDIREGNGDTSLVLFGENVTPNQHALATEFVLLDNFYVDAEVSADGHNWSMGAYATDYLEKTWPTSYGGRGGGYDAEGTRAIANNKNGFIWDMCKRYNVTYRTYGEFADDAKANIPVLDGHVCPYFTSWDQTVRDTTRFSQWKKEFDSLLAAGSVPQLSTLRFINDHTEGSKQGRPTPFAAVADNDLAVGLFVDYLSHSPIWNESVVFILEDDAQNGPDHVDAHRSTAYLAGGLVKRKFVDHTMYSTSSLLRTIELILGLPPMSQYDASATPMWRCFSSSPTLTPFLLRPAQIDLNEINIASNEWSRKSEEFDFTLEDRAPDEEFNKVLWAAIKGVNSPFPSIKRAAFIKVNDQDE